MSYSTAIRLQFEFETDSVPLPWIFKDGSWKKCLAGYVLISTDWSSIITGAVKTGTGLKPLKN